MNWCTCPGNDEVDQAYQQDKIKMTKAKHLSYPPQPHTLDLTRGVSSHQLPTYSSPPSPSPSLESLRSRNN